MSFKIHPAVSLGLRISFTIGALWFLATKLNWQEFSEVIRQANLGWLLAALAAYGGVVLVSIVRWHLLLEVAGAPTSRPGQRDTRRNPCLPTALNQALWSVALARCASVGGDAQASSG